MTEQTNQDLGDNFRHAREQSGLTLRHIAEVTKLSVRTLDALEHGRINQLPGGIYRRAIVRAYAAEVGLDPEKTLRKFLDKHPDDVPSMEQLMPSQQEPASRRTLHAIISILSAVIPILAGVFYFASSAGGSETPRHIVDVMPPRSEVWAPEVMPAASVDPGNSVAMMITVSSPTRLQVVADGREVVARRVRGGEVIRLDLASDVVLMGDNAGAVHFSINGRAGRTLGDPGTPLSARIHRSDYHDWLIQP